VHGLNPYHTRGVFSQDVVSGAKHSVFIPQGTGAQLAGR
jgi:hypothetical protein